MVITSVPVYYFGPLDLSSSACLHLRSRGSSESAVACGNCGRQGHTSGDPNCAARGKQCSNCHKTGHFTRCCRSNPDKQKNGQTKMGKQKQLSKQKTCTAETAAQTSAAILGTVQFDRVVLSMPFSLHVELDSGSQCTAITHSMFNHSFPHNTFQQPTQTLHNFDGSLSSRVSRAFLSHKPALPTGHVWQRSMSWTTCEQVIGRDLMISLNMQLDCVAKQVCHAKDDSQVAVPTEGSSGSRVGQIPVMVFPPNGYGGPLVSTVPPV